MLQDLQLISSRIKYLDLIAKLLNDLTGKGISLSECILFYTVAASSLIWTYQHI